MERYIYSLPSHLALSIRVLGAVAKPLGEKQQLEGGGEERGKKRREVLCVIGIHVLSQGSPWAHLHMVGMLQFIFLT